MIFYNIFGSISDCSFQCVFHCSINSVNCEIFWNQFSPVSVVTMIHRQPKNQSSVPERSVFVVLSSVCTTAYTVGTRGAFIYLFIYHLFATCIALGQAKQT